MRKNAAMAENLIRSSIKTSTYIVALCGASGSIYGIRLLKALLERACHVIAIISDGGFRVMEYETGFKKNNDFAGFLKVYLRNQGVNFHKKSSLEVLCQDDFSAAPASGSFLHSGMAIAPCSMKTLAGVAAGFADNLITRSADVCLKEKRPLILVLRETPFNIIHLQNMTRLAEAGAVIMPACPSFYSRPSSIDELADTVIARILDHLNIEHDLVPRWDKPKSDM